MDIPEIAFTVAQMAEAGTFKEAMEKAKMTDEEKAKKIRDDLAAPLAAICKILDQSALDGLIASFSVQRDETNRNQPRIMVSKPL